MRGDRLVRVSCLEQPAVVGVSGRIDVYSGPVLAGQIQQLLARGQTRVVLDLTAVSGIDPSGLTVLVWAHRRLASAGGWLRLAAVCPQVAALLQITGLDRDFLLSASVQEALH